MIMKKRLYLMMGIPGSGKTTEAKSWIKSWESWTDWNIKYVSRDEIRFSIISAEDEYFAKEKDVFNRFVQEVQEGIDNYEVTVADATFLNWPSRRKLLNRLHGLSNIQVNVMWCKCDLETAIDRNSKREGRARVPENVIREMYASMTDPINDPFDYHRWVKVVTDE